MTDLLLACANCGQQLPHDALACPQCGALVYRQRLELLAAEAHQYESTEPQVASRIWRECLDLLPIDSAQYSQIQDRIQRLAGMTAGGGDAVHATPLDYAPAEKPRDTLLMGIFKTGGSMLLSIFVYAIAFQSLPFAFGFTLLILIHEFGHVIAMRYYKLSASAPFFIPFMGAVINLRQQPPNAKVEAIVGIGGPVLGTLGAFSCFALYLIYPNPILLLVSQFGFFLNLFNLLPVPPLDGGRVTAAVNPWIWMWGVVALIGLVVREKMKTGHFSFILILLLLYGWPRIWATLKNRGHQGAYYQISKTASSSIGISYLLLGALLFVMYLITSNLSRISLF